MSNDCAESEGTITLLHTGPAMWRLLHSFNRGEKDMRFPLKFLCDNLTNWSSLNRHAWGFSGNMCKVIPPRHTNKCRSSCHTDQSFTPTFLFQFTMYTAKLLFHQLPIRQRVHGDSSPIGSTAIGSAALSLCCWQLSTVTTLSLFSHHAVTVSIRWLMG